MRKNIRGASFPVLCALAALLPCGAARAADRVIAELPFSESWGAHAIITQGQTTLCDGLPEGCDPTRLLSFSPITNASGGTTISLDSSDPHFAPFVQLITNGVKDPFSFFFVGAGHAGFDSTYLGADSPTGVDLSPFIIHRIDFQVDDVSFVSPGRDLDHDGIWTDATMDGSFLFIGTCATLPVIATLPTATFRVLQSPATIHLTPPKARSACDLSPVIRGAVVSTLRPIPIVNGQVTLPRGTYTVQWGINDGYNVATSFQTVIVETGKLPPVPLD